MKVMVHPRVHQRHPDVTDEDVYAAWISCIKSLMRPNTHNLIGVGYDLSGRLLEFTAHPSQDGTDWLVYHAMRCTRKTMLELGIIPPHHAARRAS